MHPHAIAPAPVSGAAEPNAAPAFVRFRDRVRARAGTAELLAFRLGRERFAFDVRALDEAIDQPQVDACPTTPGSTLVGILRYGGRTIPVFDTARILGVSAARTTTETDAAQVLVMRSGARRIALLVDAIDDVVTLALATIKPPPFDGPDDLLIGVTWGSDDLTAILDARALITLCQQRAPEVAP